MKSSTQKIDSKIIEQIETKKKRLSGETDRYHLFTQRYIDLATLFYHYLKLDDQDTKPGREILRYFLIASISNIEGYCRLAFAGLIDSGEPFYSNAAQQFKDLQFKLDSILAIKEQKVTVGEILAHLVQSNNVRSILGTLSGLVGKDITGEIDSVASQHNSEVFKTVEEVFRIRHICCHEIKANIVLTPQWVAAATMKCHTFGFAIECIVLDSIYKAKQNEITTKSEQVIPEQSEVVR